MDGCEMAPHNILGCKSQEGFREEKDAIALTFESGDLLRGRKGMMPNPCMKFPTFGHNFLCVW